MRPYWTWERLLERHWSAICCKVTGAGKPHGKGMRGITAVLSAVVYRKTTGSQTWDSVLMAPSAGPPCARPTRPGQSPGGPPRQAPAPKLAPGLLHPAGQSTASPWRPQTLNPAHSIMASANAAIPACHRIERAAGEEIQCSGTSQHAFLRNASRYGS